MSTQGLEVRLWLKGLAVLELSERGGVGKPFRGWGKRTDVLEKGNVSGNLVGALM